MTGAPPSGPATALPSQLASAPSHRGSSLSPSLSTTRCIVHLRIDDENSGFSAQVQICRVLSSRAAVQSVAMSSCNSHPPPASPATSLDSAAETPSFADTCLLLSGADPTRAFAPTLLTTAYGGGCLACSSTGYLARLPEQFG